MVNYSERQPHTQLKEQLPANYTFIADSSVVKRCHVCSKMWPLQALSITSKPARGRCSALSCVYAVYSDVLQMSTWILECLPATWHATWHISMPNLSAHLSFGFHSSAALPLVVHAQALVCFMSVAASDCSIRLIIITHMLAAFAAGTAEHIITLLFII